MKHFTLSFYSLLLLILGFILFQFIKGRPGAEIMAIQFAKTVREEKIDADLSKWAESFRTTKAPESKHYLDIPRSEWPSFIEKLLRDDTYAKVYICFDAAGNSNGLVVQKSIEGIVIPLNRSLPELDYFSLHLLHDTQGYWAFSFYR